MVDREIGTQNAMGNDKIFSGNLLCGKLGDICRLNVESKFRPEDYTLR